MLYINYINCLLIAYRLLTPIGPNRILLVPPAACAHLERCLLGACTRGGATAVAMGLGPSRITWVCFVLGVLGAGSMLWFQIWASAIDWPANVGGKPLNSFPAFIPVAFESAILAAGIGTIITLLVRSRLFPWVQPRLTHPRVTNDHFVLAIRQTDADLDPGMAERLLRQHGAIEVQEDIDGVIR